MRIIFRQILLLIMHVALMFNATNVYANTFGQSCSALPLIDSTNYLIEDTAYGFIQKNIDMKTHVNDACLSSGDEFKFCIKNQNGDANVCTAVTMKIGDTSNLGDLSSNPDIGGKPSLTNIPLTVKVVESEICLTMPTSRGTMPLVCRNKAVSTPGTATETVDEICRTIGDSCYDGRKKSQSLLSFSGLTIHCLRDTLNKVFYIGNECPTFDDDITFTMLRPFPAFQNAMKMAIRGALILYVMIYGFKIVMNGEYAELNKIAMFVIKFIFVVYFAVGLGTKTLGDGSQVQHNGMTEFALPILVEMTSNFTEMVFLAGGSQGLCNFDASKYQSGYAFYKVWDAIDCRIGYYLGMQMLYNIGTIIRSISGTVAEGAGSAIDWGSGGGDGIEALEAEGSLTFFTVMFGFFMAGNIMIVIFGLMFVVVFMSVILYFLTAYLVCMVTLYVMAYISPIFIPMVLFEQTKGYFDSWLRIVVSCTLQPAVIGGFIALLLTMYDSAIYGNCEFQRYDYSAGEFNFSTFELRLPPVEVEKCTASFGYKLMHYYLGHGWEKQILILFEIVKIRDYLNTLVSLLYVVIYVLIFYFFIQFVNEFASDLTGGPSMASVTASPTAIIDKAINVAKAAVSATKAAVKAYAGDGEGAASDAMDAGEELSEDTTSNKTSRSGDKVSTGKDSSTSSDSISTGKEE